MWPLRVGPLNPLNGVIETDKSTGLSNDAPNQKNRSFDNTLVMSFVEHTIVLTLTGEEVSND